MKENSEMVGAKTLETFSAATQFNRWMFEAVNPFINGDVLEVGSGIGNMSAFLATKTPHLVLTDIDEDYLQHLRSRYQSNAVVKEIISVDLNDIEFDSKFSRLFSSFDTVIALNVVEHIKDDNVAIENCVKLLRPNGRLIILVPAYPALFNRLDEQLHHYRRYTFAKLRGLLQNHTKLVHSFHFNFAGIFGWWVSGTVCKNGIIPKAQMKLFNALVPVFKMMDKIIANKAGLSVIAVGEKAVSKEIRR